MKIHDHYDLTPEEKRKLALMRTANTAASTRFNIGGVEKTRGWRRPVTLPSAETLRRLVAED